MEVWGDEPRANFGLSIGVLDDIDGDAVREIVVGANELPLPVPGRAWPEGRNRPGAVVVSGKTRAILARIRGDEGWSSSGFAFDVSGAGDADRDGRADIAIGSPILDVVAAMAAEPRFREDGSGGVELRSAADGSRIWQVAGDPGQIMFGACVTTVGDLDGDGCVDLAVGEIDTRDSGRGIALLSGRTGERIGSLELPPHECEFATEFGTAIDRTGDFDGDRLRDVIIGAPELCRGPDRSVGAVLVYSAKTAAVLHRFDGTAAWQHFGCSVAGVGDVDGDGADEIAVGARGEKQGGPFSGAAYVISVRTGTRLHRWQGPPNSEFGYAVGSAGDFDADGVPDVFVGAAHEPVDPKKRGKTTVYSGKDGSHLAQEFGYAAVCVGDVNGDGGDDLAVGNHSEDDGRGVVRILLGRR